MTSFKTTIVLAALALVLGGAALVTRAFDRPTTELGASILFDFKPDEVVRVKVEFPGAEAQRPAVACERVAGGWKLTEPIETEAGAQTVGRVVAYLCTLKGTASWSESDEEIARLADAKIIVTVETRDGKNHWVQLGELTGSGFRGFARVSSRSGIWEVSKGMWDAADRSLIDFRHRRLFTVDSFDVDGVELVRSSIEYRLYKRDEEWFSEAPVGDRAEEYALFDFITMIEKAWAQEFVVESASEADRKRFGLDPPEAVVTLYGKGAVSTVEFGRTGEGESETWYARRPDRPYIVRIDPAVGKQVLLDDANAFRRRILVPDVAVWQPVGVEVKGTVKGREVYFKAKSEQFRRWQLTEPIMRYLDPSPEGTWGKFLELQVGKLSAVEFIDEEPSAEDLEKKYGLAPPELTLAFSYTRTAKPSEGLSDRTERVVIQVGRTEKKLGICYARIAGRRNVVGIPEQIKTDLERGYVRFLNRKLEPIDIRRVTAVEFEYQGEKVRWKQKADGFWVVTEPAGAGQVKPHRFQVVMGPKLERAEKLVRMFDDPAALPEEYGLTPPQAVLRITVRRDSDRGAPTKTYDIILGAFPSSESIYAMYGKGQYENGDMVFLLNRVIFDLMLELWKEARK